MERLVNGILKYKKSILVFFILATVISLFTSSMVNINYNIMDYLPEEAPSTKALDVMNEEYDKGAANVRVVLKDVSIVDALKYKEKIKKVDGVDDIQWLDDVVNIKEPLELQNQDTIESWYKNNEALFSITVNEDKEESAIDEIGEIIGENGMISGSAVNIVFAQETTEKELIKMMVILIPIILIILFLTTSSWFEPVLFLSTIGIAIIINSGTNLILGEISFVTKAAGSILQLAVSMDYSIFLLHRFSEFRNEGLAVKEAMKEAILKSVSSILSSGLTTVVGFAALIVMKFKIGPDMGFVMLKAICLSLISVLVLLPVLALYCYKLIDKTQHKSFMPKFNKFAKVSYKFRHISIILFLLLLIPCFLAQQNNSFSYGASEIYSDESTKIGHDTAAINKEFGKTNPLVLMVPKGDLVSERALCDELENIDKITSITSYAETVGITIPTEYVPDDTLSQLISDNYSRFIIVANVKVEGDETFALIDEIRNLAYKYYNDSYYFLGESVNTLDLKETIEDDNKKVNAISIIAIMLILLLTFKSLSLPIILVLVIEFSIWSNLTFNYFIGNDVFYIAYLIISSIQLGATIDYAILFTNRYIENRETMNKKEATQATISTTTVSILTSASILATAGIILGEISTNSIIAQLGILVGRGAILSLILVLFVLPALLMLLDKLIAKTTKKNKGEILINE
ncbi:MAG: MMPL family transporter [Sarcina ventriculi]|uniref:Membrane protein ydgH n=1 Tax=Sarcina ventriculi TaxID=1267 RepID=A0ABM9UQR8_SARVE|nr:MMPL family transporter [Sarcina ventriculi]MCI5636000.1 MMPL family transporter [Sarcina ventriculi]MDD7372529.1 MMPL family transporter [Sarcina ventriculi]MDY7061621.1 MMPL family transporter [Sarcina ventriculi]CUN90797.1 Putative membrane protein ydgH [Sarcina ventriculi]